MKQKKLWIVILSVVLLAALPIIGTFAYLSYVTNETDNPLLFIGTGNDKGIYAVVSEPLWDGKTLDISFDTSGNAKDAATIFQDPSDPDDPTLGITIAKKVMPNLYIPKDPKLTNLTKILAKHVDNSDISWDTPIYGALRVSFLYNQDFSHTHVGDASPTDHKKGTVLCNEDFDTYIVPFIRLGDYDTVAGALKAYTGASDVWQINPDNWEGEGVQNKENSLVKAARIFYYIGTKYQEPGKTEPGKISQWDDPASKTPPGVTEDLFDRVYADQDLGSGEANHIVYNWNGFTIKIEGAICQFEHMAAPDEMSTPLDGAKGELRGLFPAILADGSFELAS